MIRRYFFLFFITLALSLGALAQEKTPRWVRHTALSPDGSTIAFTYKGDIYTVSRQGGRARQITSHAGYETAPIWSKTGEHLVFAADWEGSLDLYVTSKVGGTAKRLTFNSVSEEPVAFLNDTTVIFGANVRPDVDMGIFPYRGFAQLYQVGINGGRPTLFSATTMVDPSIGADGRILYTDVKGYEDNFRKHHISSIARDIWMYTPAENGIGNYEKLTTFEGEDRDAHWLPDQSGYLYTNESDGTLNIYRATFDGKAPVQLTHFTKHPVRYMSMDGEGNVSFSWNGELYYMPFGGEARKVDVEVIADYYSPAVQYRTLTSGATSVSVSPNEKEVALIVRGDLYVTNIEYGTTKRITNTPDQERNVQFSPDGRSIVYSSERNGRWNLYLAKLVRKEDEHFTYAQEIEEVQLTDSELPSFQPVFRPDGKEIAFLRDRTAIYVLNLDTMQERQVMDKKYNYSYSDGDQYFDWSPDGLWIITEYIGVGGWNNKDIAIVKADGSGETHNLTNSGYSAVGGRFVLDGKAVVYGSDFAGYRSHGSWGAEYDLYMMFLDQEAYDRHILNKEERERYDAVHKVNNKKNDSKGDDDKKENPKLLPALTFDLEHRNHRIVRLTRSSGFQSDYALTPDGKTLYYIAYFDDSSNLYKVDLVKKETELLLADVGDGALQLSKDGKTLYHFSHKGLTKIEGRERKPIKYSAKFDHVPAEERAYIFDHVVKQVENKFYDANLHGVDWHGYAKAYRTFLPHINNNYDFAEMLSELLGELNASHTGARYGHGGTSQATAALGLFYDKDYHGVGLKIAEVIQRGPLDKATSIAAPGVILLKVNGKEIGANEPLEKYLNGMVGEWITITLLDQKGNEVEELVQPISHGEESDLLYWRWVKQREEMVREWSGGKIAYIHVRGMDSPSFRRTFRDLLGKYRHADAVVIDTRFNGGGWLHEDLAILLSGKEYCRFTPRGQYIGSDPFAQWFKPSIVLMGEGNYSNAHGFPWVYKQLGIGKLIGAPVPGTMTAVWWERQVDPSIVFGIPQTTVSDLDGKPLENEQLYPDILIYNTPEQNLENYDAQLKAAVDELLKK